MLAGYQGDRGLQEGVQVGVGGGGGRVLDVDGVYSSFLNKGGVLIISLIGHC